MDETKKNIKFWFHGVVIMNFKPKFLKIVSTIPIQSFAVRNFDYCLLKSMLTIYDEVLNKKVGC
jgi:hypothetical protein